MHLQNNSFEWLITYFGIIKLGAVVVPLNFRFIESDIIYAASVCNPKMFIIGSEFLPVVQSIQKELTSVEKYICVGNKVPDDMVDYKIVEAFDDIEEAIVDVKENELGPGEIGELIFASNRMMKEYYNNPEKTAQTLKDGWLYTGDLAKTDEEGFFYIVDRIKDMISSGGENVYPVEIEDALMDHPKINDVACIGYPDERFVEIVLAIVE